MLTLKPDMRDGTFVICNETGDPIGHGKAVASRTIPGYVSLVSSLPLGYAIRVPADWIVELQQTEEGHTCPATT